MHQGRNYEHLTLARFFQTFINSKQDPKKSQPIRDESLLLPHPHVWKALHDDSELVVSPKTAKDILTAYEWLNSGHKAVLDKHLMYLRTQAK